MTERLTDEQISETLFLMDGDQYYDDPSGYFEVALTELQQARAEIERLRDENKNFRYFLKDLAETHDCNLYGIQSIAKEYLEPLGREDCR